jgi:hypothetical protein
MVLLCHMGHVESCFSPFGDGVSVSARKVHGLRQTCHRLKNRFGCPIVLLGDEAQVEAHFGLFRVSANLDTR